jgi:hypothetical protein
MSEATLGDKMLRLPYETLKPSKTVAAGFSAASEPWSATLTWVAADRIRFTAPVSEHTSGATAANAMVSHTDRAEP